MTSPNCFSWLALLMVLTVLPACTSAAKVPVANLCTMQQIRVSDEVRAALLGLASGREPPSGLEDTLKDIALHNSFLRQECPREARRN